MKVIDGMYYTKEHEWVAVEDGNAKIGITDFAQDALGDIAYVELPEEGEYFEEGDVLGVIESVKTASDFFAPISGQVVEVNEYIEEDPGIINEDPYKSWLVSLTVDDDSQLEKLMPADSYEDFSKDE